MLLLQEILLFLEDLHSQALEEEVYQQRLSARVQSVKEQLESLLSKLLSARTSKRRKLHSKQKLPESIETSEASVAKLKLEEENETL